MRRIISHGIAGVLISIWVLDLSNFAHGATDRINLDVTVNGQPVHMVFDTGATDTMLFSSAAERLGLRLSPAKVKSALKVEVTQPVNVSVFGITTKTILFVIAPPAGINSDIDGVVGWGQLQHNLWVFDGTNHRVSVGVALPDEARQWTKLRVHPGDGDLWLEAPLASEKTGLILIDTGNSNGVSLNSTAWKQWRSDHPTAPRSIFAAATVYQRAIVGDECWADELSLGPLRLHGVPICEATRHETDAPHYLATIGLYALRRMDMVVDGKDGWAYVRPMRSAPAPYSHNRAGVVFLPDEKSGEDLSAHVIEGGPTYQAGVRDGDVLLKIDSLDVTRWKSDPIVLPLSRFWERPAGAILRLSLRRGEQAYQVEVRLEQILGPKE